MCTDSIPVLKKKKKKHSSKLGREINIFNVT